MNKKMLWILSGMLALPVIAAIASPRFMDPLDEPARMRLQIMKSPMTAVALAGDKIFSAGRQGMILASRDGGVSWKQATVPVQSDLVALAFPTPSQGWAVGHDGVVLSTADAGTTWVKRLDGRSAAKLIVDYYTRELALHPNDRALADALTQAEVLVRDGPDKPFLDVWFKDEKHGFVIGAFNLILATEDGGATWNPWLDRVDNPQRFHLTSIRGDAEDTYIAGEQGLLLKLDVVARRFVAVNSPYNGSYFGVVSKGQSLVLFGLKGHAFRSDDGSRTWKTLSTGTDSTLTSGTFLQDGRLVLVGDDGTVLVTAGDGGHFTQLNCGMSCYAVAPGKADSIIVAGSSGVLRLALR